MKLFGVKVTNVKLKDGKLEKTDTTPKPLRKGKFAKAARQEKAWKGKSK